VLSLANKGGLVEVPRILVSVSDAALMLGTGKSAIYKLLNGGELAGCYKGAKRFVFAQSVLDYAHSLPTERQTDGAA
jgi:hypothetical protein